MPHSSFFVRCSGENHSVPLAGFGKVLKSHSARVGLNGAAYPSERRWLNNLDCVASIGDCTALLFTLAIDVAWCWADYTYTDCGTRGASLDAARLRTLYSLIRRDSHHLLVTIDLGASLVGPWRSQWTLKVRLTNLWSLVVWFAWFLGAS